LQEEYRLQSERERIAMELHDNVGSQLTYLINKIDDDYPMLADKKEADQLSNFARGAMQELRETIWALDKKEVLLYDLDHKIMQLTELYNREKNIVRYDWNGSSTNVTSVKSLQALNIYRIIQEALNNAIKYSEAEKIYVVVEMKGRTINIKITDDGKGFDMQKIVPGYGLRNMKNRAREMNAMLDISSEAGKGAVISLSVPLN
jgi:signal transduction histidine kinase